MRPVARVTCECANCGVPIVCRATEIQSFCSRACVFEARRRNSLTSAPITALAFARSIPEPNSGCWLWLGATKHGYPFLWRGPRGERRHIFVHRQVCEEKHGPLGPLIARHTCDVPLCVNPDHVIPGTHADNVADKMGRGRHRALAGELCPRSKLTLEQVTAIRATAHIHGSGRRWARELGVLPNTIWEIRAGRTWR